MRGGGQAPINETKEHQNQQSKPSSDLGFMISQIIIVGQIDNGEREKTISEFSSSKTISQITKSATGRGRKQKSKTSNGKTPINRGGGEWWPQTIHHCRPNI
ncbi:hypothetical protein Dimus_025876 [Dionaea muscipula]